MIPPRLRRGDMIGIVSPSHVAEKERYAAILNSVETMGFRVRTGKNLYKDTDMYLACIEERASDFNDMIRDTQVRMVFFGGGEGALEILPFLDYDAARQNPKIYASYSDGTSILNAIYAKTGLVTYYGQTPGECVAMTAYDSAQFDAHFTESGAGSWIRNSAWHFLHGGRCEGVLIGGYTLNFALDCTTEYVARTPGTRYLLFLEDHEGFNGIAAVSALLSHIEQSPLMPQVGGLLFGNYADTIYPAFMARLRRFGQAHGIPVAYCDDFGHGKNHAILPIGGRAILDADAQSMYLYG